MLKHACRRGGEQDSVKNLNIDGGQMLKLAYRRGTSVKNLHIDRGQILKLAYRRGSRQS